MKKEKQITCFECGTAYFNNLDACPHCACPTTYNLDNYKINTLDTNNGQVEVNNNEIENDLLDKQNLEPQKNIDDELLISQTNEIVETNIIKTNVEEKTKLLKLNVFKRFSFVKRKVSNVILVFIISLSVFMIFHGNETIKYTISNYNLMTGNYEEALLGFSEISEFLNSEELITETQYQEAKSYHDQDLLKSIELLQEIKNQDYKDSNVLISEYKYEYAIKLFNNKEYLNAANYFNSIDYLDSREQYSKSIYEYALELFNQKSYMAASTYFGKIDYLDSKEKNEESIYQYAYSLFDKNEFQLAAEFFNKSSYSNSDEMYKESIYNLASIEFNDKNYNSALEYFTLVNDYKDSNDYIFKIKNRNTTKYYSTNENYKILSVIGTEVADILLSNLNSNDYIENVYFINKTSQDTTLEKEAVSNFVLSSGRSKSVCTATVDSSRVFMPFIEGNSSIFYGTIANYNWGYGGGWNFPEAIYEFLSHDKCGSILIIGSYYTYDTSAIINKLRENGDFTPIILNN